jgi:hypothetical protein
MSTEMTIEDVVAELRDMLEVSRRNPTLAQRLGGGALTVLYEFQTGGPEPTPYLLTVERDRRAIEPGAIPYEQADIVIRTEPLTLHRLTSGELGGREAIVSGLLDIRKAPSMPKLLLMRSLFNRYKKALQRGEITGPGSGANCAVEARLEQQADPRGRSA